MANWDGSKQRKKIFSVTQDVDSTMVDTFCVEANDLATAIKKVSAFLGVDAANYTGVKIFQTKTWTSEYVLEHGRLVNEGHSEFE